MRLESVSAVRAGRPERLAAYLEQARAGETAALDHIVEELNPLLWHVARSQGLGSEDAADVVQTVWLELVRQLHAIRTPLALTAWLVQTTRREAWQASGRARRQRVTSDEMLAEFEDPAAEQPGAELVVQETYRALWRNFALLPERCQTLLRVVAQSDPPNYAAVSEALGMPHGSIGPTRGRCLAKLRELLLADPEWNAE